MVRSLDFGARLAPAVCGDDRGLLLYPAHYSGSVCGRGLSANPASTIGFERRHNPALQFDSEEAFVAALTSDIPPPPEQQDAIIAANRSGRPIAEIR